jgi:hypothetical protein
MRTKNLSQILSPGELQWFGQLLSESQIWEGIAEAAKFQPNPSHWLIFSVLKAARSRVEDGVAPYGKLRESSSAENIQRAIEEQKRQARELTRLFPI